jgi:hypothetical protein
MEMALPENSPDQKQQQIKIAEKNLLTVYVMRLNDRDSLAYRVGNDSPKPLSWALLGDTLRQRREIAGFTVQDTLRKPNLTVLAKIDRKATYESLVNLVDQFNVDSVNRFSIDKYTTMDDSLMRAVGFMTAGPEGLPEPQQATDESSD